MEIRKHQPRLRTPYKGYASMSAYHPTTINMHNNHCPWAVQMWKEKIPYDRSIFHTGVVAHAILEEIGNNPDKDPQEIADNIVKTYCSKGRSYDAEPEPPAPLSDALRGAKLALEWNSKFPVPHGEGVTHEHQFAFDKEWNPVPYFHKSAKFRTLLDVVEIYEEYDETTDDTYTKAIIRDYKTSWVATKDELDSFQRRCQAVVVWLMYKPDIMVLEIANLRLKCHFRKELNVHFEEDTLKQWQHDISLAIDIMDQPLKPNPGIGCIQCPYTPRCYFFDDMYKSEDIVKQYIAAKEIIAKLEPQIKKATKEKPPQQMSLGNVGYASKERKKVKPTAKQILLEEWKNQNGTIEQLFSSLDLGVRTVDKIAKLLTNSRVDRDELMDKITRVENYSSFGIHKDKRK